MTLRLRMGVARTLLAQWEQADDAAVRTRDARLFESSCEAWRSLDEWLDRTDLRGSSFDPRSDLYLSVSI